MPAIIIPKGHFIVMKTGTHPMRTRLRLFLEWGITFGEPYSIPEKAARSVAYANKQELELAIMCRHVRMPAASGAAPVSKKRLPDGGIRPIPQQTIPARSHLMGRKACAHEDIVYGLFSEYLPLRPEPQGQSGLYVSQRSRRQ